ncbi:MAG: class 1 isoprenoid biosynthesis enzyme [Eubacteriales bacterium]|nr:class 1 isoprenoid biosynthesis enzyme [Eubacteriales bacterium]
MKAFHKTIDSYIALWYQKEMAEFDCSQSSAIWPIHQFYRYFRLKRQINLLCQKIKNNPTKDLSENQDLQRLIETWLGVDTALMKQKIDGDYVKCTREFIENVKCRWPDMDEDSIFQALRNVWIMNTIQIMHELPVKMTNAIFAYSMLYPLTDNYLDDEKVLLTEKQKFVSRFRKRLESLYVNPINSHEQDIFDMVSLIERDFCRIKHPEVFESLLLIHDGQCMSLKQQNEIQEERVTLKLSFEKGGASVVADAYLVLGELDEEQLRFYTGYGIALQLADDLQDLSEDLENKHYTLYNSHESLEQRWSDTKKMMSLCDEILTYVPMKDSALKNQIILLLKNSLKLLISDAIYEQRDFFSEDAIHIVNQMQSVRLKHHWKLKQISQRWMKELKPILERIN